MGGGENPDPPGEPAETGKTRPAERGFATIIISLQDRPSFIPPRTLPVFSRFSVSAGWGNPSGGRGKLRPFRSGIPPVRHGTGRTAPLWKSWAVGRTRGETRLLWKEAWQETSGNLVQRPLNVRHGATCGGRVRLLVWRPSVKFSSVRRLALFARMAKTDQRAGFPPQALNGAGSEGIFGSPAGSGGTGCGFPAPGRSHFGKILFSGVRKMLFREFSTGFSGFSRGRSDFPGCRDRRICRSAAGSTGGRGGKDWFSTKVFLRLWKTTVHCRAFSAACGESCR